MYKSCFRSGRWSLLTGKPVTKSAGTADETAAIGKAAVWQDELNSGRYQAQAMMRRATNHGRRI